MECQRWLSHLQLSWISRWCCYILEPRTLEEKQREWEFPGGLVVKTQCCQCWRLRELLPQKLSGQPKRKKSITLVLETLHSRGYYKTFNDKIRKWDSGMSLVVQWLGLSTFTVVSLVGELRFCKWSSQPPPSPPKKRVRSRLRKDQC